ncbi:phosphotransferase family protein [soil metagenome]
MTAPDPMLTANETERRLRSLEQWLESRLDGASDLALEHLGKPGSGFSAETIILRATWNEDGRPRDERFVLRQENPDPAIYPPQTPALDGAVEVDLQYRLMQALSAASDLPLAPLVDFEPEASLVGTPFFVMGFVDGVVPVEAPMYTLEGFFTELTPEQRTAMVDDGMRMLATVHRVDWRDAGLDWLVAPDEAPTAARQLAIWERYADDALRGREHAPLAAAFDWLRANQPEESEPALCWGDPRPGNIIWNDGLAACVTDFEAAYIGPPELDLGWWLMFDRWSHETSGLSERAPGDPTREQQIATYESLVGRSVGDMTWYELFAAARYAAIVVKVMNRWVDRGDLDADHTIWIDNPVVPCLESLLAEVGASA